MSKKTIFWKISQIPGFVRFGRTKGEIRVEKGDFRGNCEFSGVWTLFGIQPPHPPTFGRNLPKKLFSLRLPSFKSLQQQKAYLVNPPRALCSPEPTLKVGLYCKYLGQSFQWNIDVSLLCSLTCSIMLTYVSGEREWRKLRISFPSCT